MAGKLMWCKTKGVFLPALILMAGFAFRLARLRALEKKFAQMGRSDTRVSGAKEFQFAE
jgi:hypothetical protein